MKMIEPIGKSVVVKPEKIRRTSDSQGEVVALGRDAFRESRDGGTFYTVKKGDTVVFSRLSGVEVEVLGGKYLIIQENDVLAIIK